VKIITSAAVFEGPMVHGAGHAGGDVHRLGSRRDIGGRWRISQITIMIYQMRSTFPRIKWGLEGLSQTGELEEE